MYPNRSYEDAMTVSYEAFALAGVVIGAFLSYLATYSTWRRTQAIRWDERRLAAYADYGYAIKQIVNIASRIAAGRGLTRGPEPLELSAKNLAKLADAEITRSVSAETLRLLVDHRTSIASEKLTRCCWTISWMARGIIDCDQRSWQDTIATYALARDEFLISARQSLHIKGSQVPTLTPTAFFEELVIDGLKAKSNEIKASWTDVAN
jgi:hypothetical protein